MITCSKYQGCGNDFILMDHMPTNPKQMAIDVCDRHFGIGADGLMIVEESSIADFKMVYLNSDGSTASMCGNGLRCFVQYLKDQKRLTKNSAIIETKAGLIQVHIDDLTSNITLDLMLPRALTQSESTLKDSNLLVDDLNILIETLHLGTLHAVVFVDDFNSVEALGPKITSHPAFPMGINVNFVKVLDESHIEVRTHERGAGWTLACGTGMTASSVVAHRHHKTNASLLVSSLGGTCHVSISDQFISLCGPAIKIADIRYTGGTHAV